MSTKTKEVPVAIAPIKHSDETLAQLKQFGLDFIIAKEPQNVVYMGRPIKSNYVNLINTKTDEVIHVAKSGYHVSQNADILEMVNRAASSFKNIEVVFAGNIQNGKKVYIQLKVQGDAFIGDDVVTKYITIIDSNDGSTQLSVGISDFTMSCANQYFQFYRAGQSKFKHTASLSLKIRELKPLIEAALSRTMRMEELYKDFQSTPVTRELAKNMVDTLLGYDCDGEDLTNRATANIKKLWENIDHELEDKGMNIWGLFSGVTRWTTHDKQAPKRANGRVEAIISGDSYKKNQIALTFAMNLLPVEKQLA
tara:strand:+ start:12916 stop:13842 length:927 start_codon:yes stop_codon:yes gene_type:complete